MSQRENQGNFKWGLKSDIRTNDSEVNFYRSFTYQGVEYSQFDCVYMFREGAKDTDIGKITRMWEKKKEKKLKILWFFRPIDIRGFLRDYEPSWNELFLASGSGRGLCNIVPPEAVIGKCSVICTSKDSRNTLPSKSDLGKAEYFFSHVFDVGNLRISDKFPDKIDTVKVDCLFYQDKDKPKAHLVCSTSVSTGARTKDIGNPVSSVEKVGTSDIKVNPSASILKDEASRTSEDFEQHVSENQPFKKRRILPMKEEDSANLLPKMVEDPTSILDALPSHTSSKSPKKDASDSSNIHQNSAVGDKETLQPAKYTADKVSDPAVEISRMIIDTRKWFNKLPWEERVKRARDQKTLVYIDNLDSSYTSSQVQDMFLTAFNMRADVKIVLHGSFSSPSYGQALAIFESKDDADFVISELRRKCLMVGEGRPVVAYRSDLIERDKPSIFHGHLVIEKLKKLKWGEDKKREVSTSHCTQPNTIEYDMAIQWRVLQERSDLWWKALHKEQANEISRFF